MALRDGTEKSARVYKVLVIATCVVTCVAAVQYMQSLFDQGDLRRARTVVAGFVGANGQTLDQQIRARHGSNLAADPHWDVAIVSSFFGVIEAKATVALRQGRPAVYRWEVDLISNAIHPADEPGRAVLDEMSEGNGVSTDDVRTEKTPRSAP